MLKRLGYLLLEYRSRIAGFCGFCCDHQGYLDLARVPFGVRRRLIKVNQRHLRVRENASELARLQRVEQTNRRNGVASHLFTRFRPLKSTVTSVCSFKSRSSLSTRTRTGMRCVALSARIPIERILPGYVLAL
jgi:hypothetical protein